MTPAIQRLREAVEKTKSELEFYQANGSRPTAKVSMVGISLSDAAALLEEVERGRVMTDDEIYELGKKEIDYERHLTLFGKKKADNVLYFWMKGYKCKEPPAPAVDWEKMGKYLQHKNDCAKTKTDQ